MIPWRGSVSLGNRKSFLENAKQSKLYKIFQDKFDAEFFGNRYRHLLPPGPAARSGRDIDLLLFYITHVRDVLFDPNSDFSEIEYLAVHDDVKAAVEGGGFLCGFHHWILHGETEKRLRRINTKIANIASRRERVELVFDPEYYAKEYMNVPNWRVVKEEAIAHFLSNGLDTGVVPGPPDTFDEAFYTSYYEDVGCAKEQKRIPSGYFHYVHTGMLEGRSPKYNSARLLECKFGDLVFPTAIETLSGLYSRLKPVPLSVCRSRYPVFNIFIPSLDPDIMFGGYIAFMHFLCRLVEHGQKLRFLIMEDGQSNKAWFLKGIASRQRWVNAFARQEFLNISAKDNPVKFGYSDSCVAYSCWTMHDAWSVAQHLSRKYVLFFIQEDETIFHNFDSMNFIASSAYRIPHIAIFNSDLLYQHFEREGIGVFSRSGTGKYMYFNHAIGNVRPAKVSTRMIKARRRLLCYARPEKHAARNLFEVCVIVLSKALCEGVFDGDWEFVGIGMIGASRIVELGDGKQMSIIPRVEQGEYELLLQSFDVGLSLMWAPHPGVIHFEMAKAGVITVTNAFGIRTKEVLARFGHNIVPCDPSIPDLVEGLRTAVLRSADWAARVQGSQIAMPSDWDDVFNEGFYEQLQELFSVDSLIFGGKSSILRR